MDHHTSQPKRSNPAVTAKSIHSNQTPSMPTFLFGIDKLNFKRNLKVSLLRVWFWSGFSMLVTKRNKRSQKSSRKLKRL